MVEFIKKRWRLSVALITAVVVIGILVFFTDRTTLFYVLLGWDVLIWIYMLLLWYFMLKADATNIPSYARQHDQGALVILLAFCVGAVLSFVSVVIFLLHQNISQQHYPLSFIVLSSSSLIGAWLIVPSIFTMHYAHEFYLNKQPPALLFPDQPEQPDYLDFAYFSFTVAVASQTADVAVGTSKMRRLVLLQSLLAFMFNASILGLTVNIVAGLL